MLTSILLKHNFHNKGKRFVSKLTRSTSSHVQSKAEETKSEIAKWSIVQALKGSQIIYQFIADHSIIRKWIMMCKPEGKEDVSLVSSNAIEYFMETSLVRV